MQNKFSLITVDWSGWNNVAWNTSSVFCTN